MRKLIESAVWSAGADAKREIEERWQAFEAVRMKDEDEWFSELCFCLLTANTSAEMGMRVQERLGYKGFAESSESGLAEALKGAGSRFYNRRAEYIALARRHNGKLKKVLGGMGNQFKMREWLVKNVKGMGYKEASHFLRNTGHGDLAILDKHIISVLREHELIGEFKGMGKRRYIAVEHVLRMAAGEAHMPLGKLDLYLWRCKTGKVLK